MIIGEEENYTRCKTCIYCREIELKKGNKVIATNLECTCESAKETLNDFQHCNCYKSYEEDYKEQMKKVTEMVKGTDNVNHPKHYANSCSIECIDAMQATFGTKDLAKYCAVNAYKYLWRYKSKNGLEDLKKAEWYLNKFDELLEESDNKPYSEQISSRYVNVCITLRKWLKMANTALGGNTVNEE